ncbi:hypothetical protein AA14337_3404 [Acetobacter malorum DSM 14337]|uniref:Uncharacterized protein n=1 Tax=Acetobacter malorum DSM 14337 TaxID=1307910 RepID=A0ABQ0Q1E5_9PROT|nr:hypothetical protein [Acetobacter malorum]KXV06539.1 hypothetical protein AD930_08075 [Acetobacter malorum]GBQ86746.1 hypothetical protein AA14337_3404 [Acetobacter malorum DSM 14337]
MCKSGAGEGRGYLPWITVITFVYLVFELSFNARLLDVIGAGGSANAVKNIEDWGRILSGMAVTILIWGNFIMPRRSLSVVARIVLMAVSCVICVKSVYTLEKKLVTHFVDISSGQQRKEAVAINFVVGGVQDGSIDLSGFPLIVGPKASASDKQMMAILPFYVLSLKNVDLKISSGIKTAIHNAIVRNSVNSQKLFDDGYKPFVNRMHDTFKDYSRLEGERVKGTSYRRHMIDVFGYLPANPYYRFSDFFASAGIQHKAKESLGIDNATFSIPPDLTPYTFRSDLWPKVIGFRTDDIFANQIDHPAKDYENGGSRELVGRNGMEAMVAPPVALFFSVLGALTHIFKSVNYLLRWKLPALRFRKTILIGSLLGIAAFVGCRQNAIVDTNLYQTMAASVCAYYPYGSLMSQAFTWLIKMQAVFYPINEMVRNTLLFGLTFGA